MITASAMEELMNMKHNFFKNTFFPSNIVEWNKIDLKLNKF